MPIVLGLQSHSIPRRSNQLRVFPSTATMRARSTYSLLKPQHPSTGDPRAFVLGLGLGFGLVGHRKIFFFPTAAVDNFNAGTAIYQLYMLSNLGNFS